MTQPLAALRTFWVTDRRLANRDVFDIRALVFSFAGITTAHHAFSVLCSAESVAGYAWFRNIAAESPGLAQSQLKLFDMLRDAYRRPACRTAVIIQIAMDNDDPSRCDVLRAIAVCASAFTQHTHRSCAANAAICYRLFVITLDKYRRDGCSGSLGEVLQQHTGLDKMTILRRMRGSEATAYLLQHGDYDPIGRFEALQYDSTPRRVDMFVGCTSHTELVSALVASGNHNALLLMRCARACGVTMRDFYESYAVMRRQGKLVNYLHCITATRSLFDIIDRDEVREVTGLPYAHFLVLCGRFMDACNAGAVSPEDMAEINDAGQTLLQMVVTNSRYRLRRQPFTQLVSICDPTGLHLLIGPQCTPARIRHVREYLSARDMGDVKEYVRTTLGSYASFVFGSQFDANTAASKITEEELTDGLDWRLDWRLALDAGSDG